MTGTQPARGAPGSGSALGGMLLPGVLVAVLWWATAALGVRLDSDARAPGSFLALVLPSAVPDATWVSVQPWPVLAPALSALAAGALTAAGCLLLRRAAGRGELSGAPAFLSAWLLVVAASAVTGLGLGIGLTFTRWPPARLWFLFDAIPAPLQSAAVLGLVWGWLPALFAARALAAASPRADAPRTARTWPIAVLAIVLLLAAGLGQQRARPAPVADPGAAVPTQTPAATPIPTAVAAAGPIDTDWCAPDQIELSASPGGGAAGHRALTLSVTNRTGVDCVLDGYPDLAFGDANDSLLALHLVRGGSFLTQDAGPVRIVLGAGQSAQAVLGWDAQASDPAHQVHWIAVAAYPGTLRTQLPVQVDLIAGASAAVTAWAAAAPAEG